MTRIVVFLVLLTLLALAGAWFADQPGDVAITWLGRHIEMSVFALAAMIFAIVVVAVLLWSIARLIMRTPDIVTLIFRNRRRDKLMHAQTSGLLAVGSGDLRLAERQASEARRIDADAPLTLLLTAQTAQMRGDRIEADRAFKAMLGHEETRALGLRGLFIEARRRDDPAAARDYAERALAEGRPAPWAGVAMLEQQTIDGDWDGALKTLEANARAGIVERDAARRQRAVLLTAQSLADGVLDDKALALALEAHKLAPDLVPAAVRAARILASQGHVRRVVKLVEQTWRLTPHPDLADIYTHARLGDSARDRLGRAESLARIVTDEPEGKLAVARASIEAGDFVRARAVLAPLLDKPTGRVCLLMAKLEQDVTGDLAKARGWLARAVNAAPDPAWTADGYVSDRWLPASPLTGRLDAFTWKVPLAALGAGNRLSEIDAVVADADEPPTIALPEPPVALPPAPAPAFEPPAEPVAAKPTVAEAIVTKIDETKPAEPLPTPLAEIRDRITAPAVAPEPVRPRLEVVETPKAPVDSVAIKLPEAKESDVKGAETKQPDAKAPDAKAADADSPAKAPEAEAPKPAVADDAAPKPSEAKPPAAPAAAATRNGEAIDAVPKPAGPPRPLPAVFPLAHAPDDPGLEDVPAEPKPRFKLFGG